MRIARLAAVLVLLAGPVASDEVPLALEPVRFGPGVHDLWASDYDAFGARSSSEIAPEGYAGDFRSARWELVRIDLGERSIAIAFDESGGTGKGFDRILVDLDGDRAFRADEERSLEAGRARLELPNPDGEPIHVEVVPPPDPLAPGDLPEWLVRVLEALGPRGKELEAELSALERRGRSALLELQSREGWPQAIGDLVPRPGRSFSRLRVWPAQARIGRLEVGGSEVAVGVAEAWSLSDEEGPRRILILDRDGDGTFAPDETQPLDWLLVHEGRTCRLALAPGGESLSIEPVALETGVLVVPRSQVGSRLLLESETHGNFGVVLEPETRLPIGRYAARYSTTRVVEGVRWTLATRETRPLDVGAGRSLLEAIDPRIVPAVELADGGTEMIFRLSLSDGNGVPVSVHRNGVPLAIGFVLRDDRGREVFRGTFHPG